MNYVATKSINYGEAFRLVLREGQFMWEYGLVIRERQKYIYAAGDTLWVAVVDIIQEGQTHLEKPKGPRAIQGCSRDFREKIKGDQDGWAGQMQI